MKLQRYDFRATDVMLGECEDGDFVRYEDCAALEAEIERLRAEIERLNKLLTKDLMYWESSRVEDNASEEPWEIADRVADEYLGPGEGQVVEVQVAARLPDRKMRVWRDANGDMKWEWVE